MLWRRLKLDGAYLLGELVIVVAGVLIALGVNSWYQSRQQRAEEIDVLRRLAADLANDTAQYSVMLEFVAGKRESLRRVGDALERGGAVEDSMAFLVDVTAGSGMGWNQPFNSRSTFDDLTASGSLDVLRDASLRVQLAAYYALEADSHERMGLRRTRYPEIAYRLVPRENEVLPDPSLDRREVAETVRAIVASDLRDEITAELNLARFISELFGDGLNASRQLHSAVASRLAELGAP
jgi:hypothetical protein